MSKRLISWIKQECCWWLKTTWDHLRDIFDICFIYHRPKIIYTNTSSLFLANNIAADFRQTMSFFELHVRNPQTLKKQAYKLWMRRYFNRCVNPSLMNWTESFWAQSKVNGPGRTGAIKTECGIYYDYSHFSFTSHTGTNSGIEPLTFSLK